MGTADKWHRFRELPADIQTRLQQLPALFAREGVLLTYLFGSLARAETGQDVDLALLMPEEKRPYRLHQPIADTLGIERLDIIDLRRASPVLRYEIISTGLCIYAADDDIQLDCELKWLREYRDTAWLRRRQDGLLAERMKQWSSDATASLRE
ncbi:MAG: nucleotidyltransferase domain-containing protein [Anaerolineae bacterium]